MERDSQTEGSKAFSPRRNSIGTGIIIGVLLALLGATGAMVYLGWTIDDAGMPTSGYVAMAVGVIFSLVVGVGLMALVFYSSRRGYDEPAVLSDGNRDHEGRQEASNGASDNGASDRPTR